MTNKRTDITNMTIVELGNLLYEEIMKLENIKNNIAIIQKERDNKIKEEQKVVEIKED